MTSILHWAPKYQEEERIITEQQQERRGRRTSPLRDSVDEGLQKFMTELPSVDASMVAASYRILRMARLIEATGAQTAARNGLTVGDWEILSVLRRSGPPHTKEPTQLAKVLQVAQGTMSMRIERLAREGLVEYLTADDKRRRPVRLTQQGHRAWQATTFAQAEIEQKLISNGLSSVELERLNGLLRKMLIHAEAEFGPAPQRGESSPEGLAAPVPNSERKYVGTPTPTSPPRNNQRERDT